MAKIIDLDQVRAGTSIEGDWTPVDPNPGGNDAPCLLVDNVCTGTDSPCGLVDNACGGGGDAWCGIDHACGRTTVPIGGVVKAL